MEDSLTLSEDSVNSDNYLDINTKINSEVKKINEENNLKDNEEIKRFNTKKNDLINIIKKYQIVKKEKKR